jgi:tetratricopeptide (TPR) repeat protein
MNHFFLALLVIQTACAALHAEEPTSSIQEGLALRRIAEYWKEGDYAAARRQVLDFLAKHEGSAYADPLHAMLGDLFFQEKNFQKAVDAYGQIKGEEFVKKTTLHYLQSLFEMERFAEVAKHASLALMTHVESKELDTIRFLLAESLFRQSRITADPEQKQQLMTAALPHYKMVLQTKYKDYALLPLAETYKMLKDYSGATSLYLALAEKYPEKSEEYLFQAALSQVYLNKNEAIDTFEKVYLLGGKRAKEAAFNQLSLLFHSKRYKELILAQKQAQKHISSEHASLMQYFIGKSLFELGDYQNAIKPLTEYSRAKNLQQEEFKNALLCLVVCAHEQRDFTLYDRVIQELKTSFPHDPEIAKALQLRAKDSKAVGNLQHAQADLKEILADYPNHLQKEELLYDLAQLLRQTKDWQESESILTTFLKQYPDSDYSNGAWRLLLSCTGELLREASADTLLIRKERYAEVLEAALEKHKLLSGPEKQQASFAYAKTLYELDAFDEALPLLEDYVKEYPKDAKIADAHVMIALCHHKFASDSPLFTLHAEKALALNPRLPNAALIHLQLYNTYLTLTEKQKTGNKSDLMEQAADHLYQALLCGNLSIHRENQIWLADHYYKQAKGPFRTQESLSRATTLFRLLCGVDESWTLPKESMEKEGEVLTLAELLQLDRQSDKRAHLLEQLSSQQQENPTLAWKRQRQTLFELGNTYSALGCFDKALKTYETLTSSSDRAFSYYATAAQLESARLKYAMQGSASVDAILDSLKDLQIQRRLLTEPLHLEAALEYVTIKSSLAGDEEASSLLLLEKIQKEWTSPEDPLTKAYFAAAEQFPEKKHLVQLYLQFMHAEECRLKAVLAKKSGEKEKAKELASQAYDAFESLLHNAPPFASSLVERTQRSMETLKKSL